MAARYLHVTSPMMKGPEVARIQEKPVAAPTRSETTPVITAVSTRILYRSAIPISL